MTKFDIKKHYLVPKHIKISKKEAQDLFKEHNITIKELPKISRKDPAIKDLKLEAGDIIKIIRSSPTAKEAVFYRGVIDE